jgi:hypothetical protein
MKFIKLYRCNETYFDIDKWQINQPIVKTEVMNDIRKCNWSSKCSRSNF